MDILWAQLVDGITTDLEDNRVLDYGLPVHILEYGGPPARIGETILLDNPIILLCKWGRVDNTTFGDVYYAASLTSPDLSTIQMKVDVKGKEERFFSVTCPPQHYEWFTYLRLGAILYRGDGCYRITISNARYGIPVHLSMSYIASVGFILKRRQDDGQDKQATIAMYGNP
ncbi:MAG: hypothetical protein OXG23_11650 [Chloroflexi bacterium]|nr:hypothetical protein [Chloroflexota bacterium]